jgi:hypothetical protein
MSGPRQPRSNKQGTRVVIADLMGHRCIKSRRPLAAPFNGLWTARNYAAWICLPHSNPLLRLKTRPLPTMTRHQRRSALTRPV